MERRRREYSLARRLRRLERARAIFGDHKITSKKPFGKTNGNARMYEAALLHLGMDVTDRELAPPIMVFRSATVDGKVKGHVDFCGPAVIERVETIIQRDPKTGKTSPNYIFDLAVLETIEETDIIDWRWIDDRRDPEISAKAALRYAPLSWKKWVKFGSPRLPKLRRNVLAPRVVKKEDQQPKPDSVAAKILDVIYHFFDTRKVAFEALAADVAAEVLRGAGSHYEEGWITRGSGDGGADFVGRLDIGEGNASTRLVVLGQAKCVLMTTQISAEQLARVVARLRRGWIGVYVTTGTYSERAQREMLDDQYPVVLIDGAILAEIVRRLAESSHGGDIEALLATVAAGYHDRITNRRPEEILL